MTWGWGERLEEESRSYWCSKLKNHPDRINHPFYCAFETISYRLQQPIYLTCCFNHLKMYLHFDLERLRNADLNDVHWMSTYSVNSCHYLNPITKKIHGGLNLLRRSLNFSKNKFRIIFHKVFWIKIYLIIWQNHLIRLWSATVFALNLIFKCKAW